jgi:NAD(P)H dehydrogenase (quinone)
MSDNQSVLLVTGASGHLGRRVVELLLERQAGPVVAATRTPDKLADFSQRGVTVRPADFDAPDTLATAFAGVDRLLVISTDALDKPGRRLKQHLAAVKAAEEAGVTHVVYTSLTNPGPDSPILLAPDHRGTEEALGASTMGWTMLRNNLYADLLPGSLARAVQMGQLFSAAGEGKAGYVTREDCARAAAAALASDFSGRRTLDITGPESLSQADLAEIASTITGRQVSYVPLPRDVLIENMTKGGLPGPVAELIASFDTGIAQGKLDVVSKAVEDLTGRKPTRIADFLAGQREVLLQEVE